MAPVGTSLDGFVLRLIQDAYLARRLRKTAACLADMATDGLFEADVEKVIMEATSIEKAMPATSERASSRLNTHYVIPGANTKGKEVYCKVCSNYHPRTDEFVEWKLTSFKIK